MKNSSRLMLLSALLVLPCIGQAQADPNAAAVPQNAAAKDSGQVLWSKGEGDFSKYLIDDTATHVSAAALVGIADSAVSLADSTRDFGLFMQFADPKKKGGGFALTPARAQHPWPKIKLTDYAQARGFEFFRLQVLANLTLSYAQGSNEIDGVKYQRRAVALTTSGTFTSADDPYIQTAETFKACLVEASKAAESAAKSGKGPGKVDDDTHGKVLGEAGAEALAACQKPYAEAWARKWYRPMWSVGLATGDVKLDADGAASARLGETVTLAARYGRGMRSASESTDAMSQSQVKDFDWGWAVSASAKFTRNEPVLATLASAELRRQSTRLLAIRFAAGTPTWRAIAEGSDANVAAVLGGEQALKRAVGLDYQLAAGMWLNFRYGMRAKTSGAGNEAASLMSLSVSPSALKIF